MPVSVIALIVYKLHSIFLWPNFDNTWKDPRCLISFGQKKIRM